MNETNEIVTFLFTFVAGGIIGFIISHFGFASKKQNIQQKEIEASKAELDAYKAKVNNHFNDSAELMGKVANSYQDLYNHMANQSQTLLDEENSTHFPLLTTPAQTDVETDTVPTDPVLSDVDQIDINENENKETVETESNEDKSEQTESEKNSEDNAETVKEQPVDGEEIDGEEIEEANTESKPAVEADEEKSEENEEEAPTKAKEEKK